MARTANIFILELRRQLARDRKEVAALMGERYADIPCDTIHPLTVENAVVEPQLRINDIGEFATFAA